MFQQEGMQWIFACSLYLRAMITYRIATPADADAIAALHADSWQRHYRGIFTDEYLDSQVLEDRLGVWRTRFTKPAANQYAVVAEDGGRLCGFACTFAGHDPTWGALLDNLHVQAAWQGSGIGAELMRRSAQWLQAHDHTKFYLWVLEENHAARAFYERMGARYADRSIEHHAGGSRAAIIRCVWDSLEALAGQVSPGG